MRTITPSRRWRLFPCAFHGKKKVDEIIEARIECKLLGVSRAELLEQFQDCITGRAVDDERVPVVMTMTIDFAPVPGCAPVEGEE